MFCTQKTYFQYLCSPQNCVILNENQDYMNFHFSLLNRVKCCYRFRRPDFTVCKIRMSLNFMSVELEKMNAKCFLILSTNKQVVNSLTQVCDFSKYLSTDRLASQHEWQYLPNSQRKQKLHEKGHRISFLPPLRNMPGTEQIANKMFHGLMTLFNQVMVYLAN